MKCQQSAHEASDNSSEATSTASLMEIEEPVTHIQLCCRLKSFLLKKRLLRYGDIIETHAQRGKKNEALTFRVARSNEVSQIEKV
uniref:Uncharacterized protein n=1 Tax=Lactuca sativa TaxID=4236 RepID=A0A9R1UPC6_LACSA|nr:hypothetical protein LSAT_V11C800441270 [Lactuca sativa]